MNDEIRLSRQRVSRRRALSLGGTISLGALVAACGGGSEREATTQTATATATAPATTATPQPASGDVLTALDAAPSCVLAQEETQGPYWFDVDSIRRDLREDRPGTRLDLALRVQDMSECKAGGDAAPVADAVVEIWHCDAGGVYSGFESGSMGAPGGGPGGGESSDGSYSEGVQEATPTDDGTFLRGAQVTDADGVARFTTIYPGWYRGRTVHIHLKVHVDRRNVLTTQLYMDEDVNAEAYEAPPYDEHTGRDVFNDDDGIFDPSGVMTIDRTDDGYRGVINLGLNA